MTGPSNELADDWAAVLAEDPDFKGLAQSKLATPSLSPASGLTVSEGFGEEDFAPQVASMSESQKEADADAQMLAMMNETFGGSTAELSDAPSENLDTQDLASAADDMMNDWASDLAASEAPQASEPTEVKQSIPLTVSLNEEEAHAFSLAQEAILAMQDAIAASQEIDSMTAEAMDAAKKAASLANQTTEKVLAGMESKRALLEKSFGVLESALAAVGADADLEMPVEDVNMVELSKATQELSGKTHSLRERMSAMRQRLSQLNNRA
jgi:hypothetical protein